MKKTLILAIVLWPLLAMSQQRDFIFIDQDQETGQMGTFALETRDGCYFIASQASYYYTFQPSMLLKVSRDGQLLNKTTISTSIAAISGIFDGTTINPKDTCYYAVGYKINESYKAVPFVLCFDSGLNILGQTDVELPENFGYIDNPQVKLDDDGVVFFRALTDPYHALHLRFTLTGELLDYVLVPTYFVTGSLFTLPDGRYGLYAGSVLSLLTDSLTLDTIHIFNNILHEPYMGDTIHWHTIYCLSDLYPTATVLPDSSLVFAETTYEKWYDIFGHIYDTKDKGIAFVKCNLNGEVEDFVLEYSSDSVMHPASFRSIDYRTSDSVFLCAYSSLEGVATRNRIYLKLTDNELNPIWEQSYVLGLEYYEPIFILATSDGGCLITGRVHYDMFNTAMSDLFVFKVNADGTVGMKEIFAGASRPYACWPNPAKDQLHLQYSPDVEPKQVELYDLQGRLVRSQANALESLNMEGLAAGQYVMKVTMEDGTVYTDKVVKE